MEHLDVLFLRIIINEFKNKGGNNKIVEEGIKNWAGKLSVKKNWRAFFDYYFGSFQIAVYLTLFVIVF